MRSLFPSSSSPRPRWLAALALAAAFAAPAPARAFVWPNVPDQIAHALASGDVSERRAAASRLPELPAEIALRLVQQAMGDPDVEVRVRAAQAAIALRMPKAGDQVMTWLSEGDARLRLAACDLIRASPTDRSVLALGRVLGDPDAHVRLAAAAAMGSSGIPEAVSPLLGHIDDTSPEVRQEVARALGRIGDSRAVVPLIGKVQDSIPEVRKIVARALGELGDHRASSALMLALQDASPDVRLEAVAALGKLRADEATPAIAPLIDSTDTDSVTISTFPSRSRASQSTGAAEVREAALRALGHIGSDAAVKVLIGALGKDDPTAQRSPVRDALVAAGKPAITQLIATLQGSPSPTTAAGATLALGALRAPEGEGAIIRAMQRGVVELRHGLRALAEIQAPGSLPTVLEALDDPDPMTRKRAIAAAIALLDPANVDGRAVDPASAALRDATTPTDEKIELLRLLGRTGAARAREIILPFVKTGPVGLRLAAIEALGNLGAGAPEVESALIAALDDESPNIRLKAATSLSRVGGPRTAPELLRRLVIAAEQDRGALGIALSGTLSRVQDPAMASHVAAAISTAPENARDALIEGLGRMKGAAAGGILSNLGKGSIDDRRKAAEALAGHPENEADLLALAADPDAGVRTNAAWSLGTIGTRASIPTVIRLLRDPDTAVAGNAAATLGRIAARTSAISDDIKAPLCGALNEPRPYVRANALEALSLAAATCEATIARDLLARDPSEPVRLAAADYLSRTIARAGDKAAEADKRALTRCASEDRNARVAQRCARPLPLPSGAHELSVYIIPDAGNTPEARAPYTLVRPDGLLRLGIADRRGELFEFGVPDGSVRLGVPAALAR